MKQWWDARKRWERVALAICAYLVLRVVAGGSITRLFGGESSDPATVSDSFLMVLLIALGALLAVCLVAAVMLQRTVGATLLDTGYDEDSCRILNRALGIAG